MTAEKFTREARLRWVPIPKMRANPVSQRDINQARVDKMAADLDLEQIGTPTVNEAGEWFHILDGQHRIEALRQHGWGDQQIQCWTYVGLTDAEEAETALKLNDYLAQNALTKFRLGVTAGRDEDCDIDRIVRINDLVVSGDKVPGAIGAVGTLRRIYARSDPSTLARTLQIVRDAYGDPGLEAPVLDGVALVCQRYDGQLDQDDAVTKLSRAHGGVGGLLGTAENIRRGTGNYKSHCVAAAVVETINKGRGGKKLRDWFKSDDE